MRQGRTIGFVGWTLTITAILTAQQTTDPVIRVSVELMQVDATVTDAKGRHIANLNARDFEIREDGKPQSISHFLFVKGGSNEFSRTSPVPLRQGTGVSQPSPRPDQVRRSIVLFADDFGISFDAMSRVKTAMKKFVNTDVAPEDMVSILSAGGGTGTLQRFTSDKRQMLAAIDRVQWVNLAAASAFDPVRTVESPRGNPQAGIANSQRERLEQQHRVSVADGATFTLRHAIQGLSTMPGRRAVLLISEKLPAIGLLENLANEANRAGVVIDTIDPRGVLFTGLTASDEVHVTTRGNPVRDIQRAETRRQIQYSGSVNEMAYLSNATGGIFIHDTNDIGAALERAAGDLTDYYLIGYQPHRKEYGPQFHSIQVNVKRAGLQVRSRNGFFGAPDSAAANAVPSRSETMWKAAISPFEGDLPVRLRVLYSAGEPNPKTGLRETIVRGRVHIDASGLTFEDQPDGNKASVLDIVGAAISADGKTRQSRDQTYPINFTPQEWRETLAGGLLYQMAVSVDQPGAYEFLVGLRDAKSGKVGSANAFVQVPDFNSRVPMLSSIQIGGPNSADSGFSPGSTIPFECEAYGVQRNKEGKPSMEFSVRLFFGPEVIYKGAAIRAGEDSPPGRAVISGTMKLPESLPAGDYVLELMVRDKLASPDSKTMLQTSGFTLVRVPLTHLKK